MQKLAALAQQLRDLRITFMREARRTLIYKRVQITKGKFKGLCGTITAISFETGAHFQPWSLGFYVDIDARKSQWFLPGFAPKSRTHLPMDYFKVEE